jgi:predicted DNA-binding protein
MTVLKAYRLEKKIVDRLSAVAKETHRTEKFFVEAALERYLEEYADAQIAKDRFNDPHAKMLTAREMREKVGV